MNDTNESEVKRASTHSDGRVFLFHILAALLLILADQVSKYAVRTNFNLGQKKELIKNFLSLYYTRNTGSAFSFLADRSWGIYILTAISFVMSIIIFYLMYKSARVRLYPISISMMLILSGALGNLVDRFVFRYVVDFIRFDFGSYTFPIFNIADICAVCGTILIMFVLLFKQKMSDDFFAVFMSNKKEKTELPIDDSESNREQQT